MASLSEHSSINTEPNNQNSDFLYYAKTMTNMLQLEDGSEESSIISNKTTTEPEEVAIYNNKEEFQKALRFFAIKNHV